MDLEKYMIAEEGLFTKLREARASEKALKEIRSKILNMDPTAVAKLVVKCLKNFENSTDGKKINYQLAKDEESERQIRMMSYEYRANPGVINPTKSELVNINGFKCILATRTDKSSGRTEFMQLVAPVIANGKRQQEVISPMTAARLFEKNNVQI